MGRTPGQTDGREKALTYREWRTLFRAELRTLIPRMRAHDPVAIEQAIYWLQLLEQNMPNTKGGRPKLDYENAVLLTAVQLAREGLPERRWAAEIPRRLRLKPVTQQTYSDLNPQPMGTRARQVAAPDSTSPLARTHTQKLAGPISVVTVRKILTADRRRWAKQLAALAPVRKRK